MPERVFQTATLGLGGNIGDPVHAMAVGLRALDERQDCRVLAVSRLFRTPPWGKTDQSHFFNACARVETTLAAEALLDVCLDIERGMKRERVERWGPRTLDIDILTYADLVQEAPKLDLPHPRMTGRGFVLLPLADFAADLLVEGWTIREWLSRADIQGIEVADQNVDWWRTA
ncbi:2-amino-4-hydroxy-6-hydroxymethyldihydropteridine diphosphokinase [Rhizobium sp. Root1220]|uniref:2-amino-4-hydroxy-6- hydroxymethyldihydropteridine diphosphokinase n=1 Tax=Rhizobium sp. Root1220 TaxID=1736432 RepID=UPI0006F56923|nr:2-amino-4-hydroxy-6-hydroxymethyldihydropteridine diphosphokinase [Rhizobium sp. Root1220]KQV81660.1 2-amino-4-hydroxy-6-hydroxymethyldihydropteridine pyrophosphokinase [Rhizobium sp. Root1220]